MKYHILNGDALLDKFPAAQVQGQVLVIREAFIMGPVSDTYSSEYWDERKNYIERVYGATPDDYDQRVSSQFAQLGLIRDDDEVYLWFEDDLFCQCNMWFAVHYIAQHSHPCYFRIFPEPDTKTWKGFGSADQHALLRLYHEAEPMNTQDEKQMTQLWKAYVSRDRFGMQALMKEKNNGIRFLDRIVEAELARDADETGNGRPQRRLATILNSGATSFNDVFIAFSKEEGIYGFGDSQVQLLLDEMGVDVD